MTNYNNQKWNNLTFRYEIDTDDDDDDDDPNKDIGIILQLPPYISFSSMYTPQFTIILIHSYTLCDK